jgi:hypothetical protein
MSASLLQTFSYMIWNQWQQSEPQIPTSEKTRTTLSRVVSGRCVPDKSRDHFKHLRSRQRRADAFVGFGLLWRGLGF